MKTILIINATIVNEGRSFRGSLLISDENISAIGYIPEEKIPADVTVIDA